MAYVFLFLAGVVVLILVQSGFLGEYTRGKQSARFADAVNQWSQPATKAAARFNVPVELVLSVIAQESAGKRGAVGAAGEQGLMQLTDGAVTDVYDRFDLGATVLPEQQPAPSELTSEQNIIIGTAYMRLQKNRWNEVGSPQNSWFNALRAYNAGFKGSRDSVTAGASYARQVLRRAGWEANG